MYKLMVLFSIINTTRQEISRISEKFATTYY